MVQVVFVHGVATRGGPEYTDAGKNRDALFRAALFGQDAAIRSPLWGDLMPPMLFGGASFEKGGILTLGLLGTGMAAGTGGGDAKATAVLPRLAAATPAAAVDALFAERITMAEEAGVPLGGADIRAFAAAVDLLDPKAPGDPAGLAAAADDDAFVGTLGELAGRPAALGMSNPLLDAARRIGDRVRNAASRVVSGAAVAPLNPLVADFLGDVFRYLKQGGLRAEIRAKVGGDLAGAWAARKPGETLVLIGHSLGGVILYDMLSEPQAAGLPDGFRADALVTVGSQPGFFQELGLFDHTPAPQPRQGVAGPAAAGLWVNIFDPIDPFGFPATPMFTLPTDYSFDSVTGLLSAHTTYFKRPQFYARLRRRLIDAGVLP